MRKFGILLSLACALALSACLSSPEEPEEQKAFIARLDEDYKAYEKSSSTPARLQAVEKRKEFMAERAASPEFSGWVCTVHDVLTARMADGSRNMLVLPLRCGGFGLSNILELEKGSPAEAVPEGAILEGTALYDAAVNLHVQKTVIVSGRFVLANSGRIREESMTEYGSMRNPEFIVIYTDIRSAK